MAEYKDLTRMLPESVEVAGLMAVARELNISTDREAPEAPFNEYGREWERFSVYHLLLGFSESMINAQWADDSGRSMIADHHWPSFARTKAEDMGEIDHIAHLVKWDEWAAEMKTDYTEVEVADGEFRGTWFVRG